MQRLFRFLLALICLPIFASSALATANVRGNVHGLSSEQLRQLRQLPVKAVLPGALPPGYQLKGFQITSGKEAFYQLDYRCFCGGMNFTVNLIGTTRPMKAGKPLKSETVQIKGLGTRLQLNYYPAGNSIRQPYYLSSWLKRPPLQIGLFSSFEGHSAPRNDLVHILQNLVNLP